MADNGTPLILLTRPLAQAQRFAARLPQGTQARIMPLQEIVADGAIPPLSGITDVIFTSENAVRIFAEQRPNRDLFAWCVGPRTAQIAMEMGFETGDGGGSADRLVAAITAARPRGRCLHLHGRHTRGNVVERLSSQGIDATGAAIYDQRPLPAPPDLPGLATDQTVIVPLFSPRSAALFANAIADAQGHWHPICLSDAVRDQLPPPLRRKAETTKTPTAEAMLAGLARYISP